MNHRIVALARALENHSTFDTCNKKMEIQRGRVTCPDVFNSIQILCVLPKVRQDSMAWLILSHAVSFVNHAGAGLLPLAHQITL